MIKQWMLIGFISLLFITKANTQNVVIIEDERIYRRFPKEQIEQWKSNNPLQILYLNYLYKDSYLIKNNQGAVNQNIDPARTDIMNFDHMRKENERITYAVSPWGDYIELKSKKEVEKEFEKIKIEYLSKNSNNKQ